MLKGLEAKGVKKEDGKATNENREAKKEKDSNKVKSIINNNTKSLSNNEKKDYSKKNEKGDKKSLLIKVIKLIAEAIVINATVKIKSPVN